MFRSIFIVYQWLRLLQQRRERNMVKLPIEISTTASNKSNSSSSIRRNYYYIQHALVFCWWSNKSLCSFVPINTTGTSLHIRSLFIGKCAYVACFLQQQLSCSSKGEKFLLTYCHCHILLLAFRIEIICRRNFQTRIMALYWTSCSFRALIRFILLLLLSLPFKQAEEEVIKLTF